MSTSTSTVNDGGAGPAAPGSARRGWLLAAGVAVVAFAARISPILHGGGLYGLGNYDDGVYYGAAVGLVHGQLPYRDFLLLHPPAIVLALSPFAALGRIVGDPAGMALARLGWMLLGTLNAVLVTRILRPVGLFAAVLGGLGYAVFFPAIYVEQTTLLEGLGNTCLLVSLLLLGKDWSGNRRATPTLLIAGGFLGVAASTKIWGVVAVLLVLGWLVTVGGLRRAALLLVGACVAAAAICVPFLVGAPSAMWRYVVTAQLARARTRGSLRTRLTEITGLARYPSVASVTVALTAVVAFFVLAAVLAWTDRWTRLAAIMLLGLGAFLLVTPTWFPHYAALTAPPAAIVVGGAGQHAVDWLARRWRILGLTGGAGLLALVVLIASGLPRVTFGRTFPRSAFAAAVRSLPGCVTTDNPATIIEMNVLARNLDRGCELIVDLGGYSDLASNGADSPVPRALDKAWQKRALTYLRTGSATIVIRFHKNSGFTAATAAQVDSWPELLKTRGAVMRVPAGP